MNGHSSLFTEEPGGANRVDAVTFTLRDEQPVLRQVLAAATHDATLTAAALATAANVTLGPLLSLNANPSIHPPHAALCARCPEHRLHQRRPPLSRRVDGERDGECGV